MQDGLVAEMIARFEGPFAFRLLLQPLMAVALAARDGGRSAGKGETPFLWALAVDPAARRDRVLEAWGSIGRVAMLAFAMDLAFQIAVGRPVRVLDAGAIALLLAVVPYALLRGPANRLVTLMRRKRPQG